MKIGTFSKNNYLKLIILVFALIILKEKVKKNVEGTAFEYHHADDDNFRPSALPESFV